MKITLVAVGKTQSRELQETILEYSKRISHYTSFEFVDVSEERLAKELDKHDRVFLLDDKGTEYASKEFSIFIEKQLNAGVKSVAFAVGGPFGFSEEVRALADGATSLSRMTFPHDLVRVIFLEQLYRAFTIIKNEKYHHE
jgi:23S rRNA (pseudouridine1915-N3)-methyltransferase